MPGEPSTFVAQVDEFVAQSKQRMEAVSKESVQRVIGVMQTPVAAGGNMPVDTGFLRASLVMTLDAPSPLSKPNPGGTKYDYSPTAASLVINSLPLGGKLYACYTANYADKVHFGTSKFSGRQWVTLAAQRWPSIVEQVSQELKQRVSAN